MSEEDIKVNIVVPALRELGIDPGNMRFEVAFPVDNNVAKRHTFADIVLFRNNLPVLVVELKRPGINVRSPRVISQALGYARATDPSMPFAVVSNGVDVAVVEVASGTVIDLTTRSIPAMFQARLAEAVRREALALMGGPSIEELSRACRDQSTAALELLSMLGGTIIADRPYLPDQFVPRTELDAAFDVFLKGSQQVFALVGDAGMGKTSWLCNLTTRMGDSNPTVLFSAIEMSSPLRLSLDHMLSRILVSGHVDTLIDAVAHSLQQSSRTMYIVVDALNEYSHDRNTMRNDINAFVREIADYPIRLIVSCRTLDWDYWIRKEGRMIGALGRNVASGGARELGMPSFRLGQLSEDEFDAAWRLYAGAYHLPSRVLERVRRLLREPFLLRLFAETFANQSQVPTSLAPLELFDRYWLQKFPNQTSEAETGRVLRALGAKMLDSGSTKVAIADVPAGDREALGRLLDENLLIYQVRDTVAFRFELFMEYVMARSQLESDWNGGPEGRLALVGRLLDVQCSNTYGVIEDLLMFWGGSSTAASEVIALLASLDDRWKAVACAALGRLGSLGAHSSRSIFALARAVNPAVRYLLSEAIAENRSGALLPVVTALANDQTDWRPREVSAKPIEWHARRSPTALSAVLDLADDYHWRVRRAAGYALKEWFVDSRRPPGVATRRLVHELRHRSWRTRFTLAVALTGAQQPSDTYRSWVLDLVHDPNPQVRWCLANYLDKYRNYADTIVVALSRDNDPWVRCRLIQSLLRLEDSDRHRDAIIDLSSDRDAGVRLRFARDAEPTPGRAWIAGRLSQLATDADDAVAFAAVYTLTESPSQLNADLLLLIRERVARRDADQDRASFAPVYDYIQTRTEIPTRSDYYMNVIDAIGSLVRAAAEGLTHDSSATMRLLDLLGEDADEAVRWGLVAFLEDFASEVPIGDRIRYLKLLAVDAHWWIRREVAIAVGSLPDRLDPDVCREILDAIARREVESGNLCSDEVLHYVEAARSQLGDGAIR